MADQAGLSCMVQYLCDCTVTIQQLSWKPNLPGGVLLLLPVLGEWSFCCLNSIYLSVVATTLCMMAKDTQTLKTLLRCLDRYERHRKVVDEILDPTKCDPVKCHVRSRVTVEKAFLELSFSHSELKRQSNLSVDDDEVSFRLYSDKWFEDLRESYFELLEKSDQKLYEDEELEEFFNFIDDEFNDDEDDNEEDAIDGDFDLVVKAEEEPKILIKVDKSIVNKAASSSQIDSECCPLHIFSGGTIPIVSSVINDYKDAFIISKVVHTVDLAEYRNANINSRYGVSGHYLLENVGVYTKKNPPDILLDIGAQPSCDEILFLLSRGFVKVRKGPDLLTFSLYLQDSALLPVDLPEAAHFLDDQESYDVHLPVSSSSWFLVLLDTSDLFQFLGLPRISLMFSRNVVNFSFLCAERDLFWLMYRGFVRVKKGPDLSSISLLSSSTDLPPPDLPDLVVLSSISQQAQKKVPNFQKVPDIPPLPPELFNLARLSQLLQLENMKIQAVVSWILVNLVMCLQGQYMVYKGKVVLTAMV